MLDSLLAYLELLRRWNRTYNLTAVRDPADMLQQHLVDCLAAVEPLRRQVGSSSVRIADVGSGGGLPGVVLAIVEPNWSVCCVDSVGKKAAFLQQAALELALPNLTARQARVESVQQPFDVVTCRAFATLANFVTVTRQLVVDGGIWMAMKGQRPDDEIQSLPSKVEVFHVEPLELPGSDAERHLIWMRPLTT